jgi:Cu+-exporting ATPase
MKFSIFLCVVFITLSCNKSFEKNNAKSGVEIFNDSTRQADLRKVELSIEGMTCEIGCARTIQSKLSKTVGIKLATVNFEKKIGIVEYDKNKISEEQIVSVVEKIAGGDLYKVTDISSDY